MQQPTAAIAIYTANDKLLTLANCSFENMEGFIPRLKEVCQRKGLKMDLLFAHPTLEGLLKFLET